LLGELTDWEPVLARIGDPAARARATLLVGMVVLDLPTSEKLIERAPAGLRELGDRGVQAAARSRQPRAAFARARLDARRRGGGASSRPPNGAPGARRRWRTANAPRRCSRKGWACRPSWGSGPGWPAAPPGWAGSPCTRATTYGPWTCAARP